MWFANWKQIFCIINADKMKKTSNIEELGVRCLEEIDRGKEKCTCISVGYISAHNVRLGYISAHKIRLLLLFPILF